MKFWQFYYISIKEIGSLCKFEKQSTDCYTENGLVVKPGINVKQK